MKPLSTLFMLLLAYMMTACDSKKTEPTTTTENTIHIQFSTDAIEPMVQWLTQAKQTGIRDEKALRQILDRPEYQVEFERYSLPELPTCGISKEEAIDFFLNFDKKDFDNPRLQYKKAGFQKFYDSLGTSSFQSSNYILTPEDKQQLSTILTEALPEDIEVPELDVLLLVSIGNSMGWVLDNHIDFDITQMDMIQSKDDFLHLIAHEIHHILFQSLLPEDTDSLTAQEYFMVNFAQEGLAVHYCNNQPTRFKSAFHPDEPTRMMDSHDMKLYDREFDDWFIQIKHDYNAAENMSVEEVDSLLGENYFNMNLHSLRHAEDKIRSQYPVYYFGCYFWGIIHEAFGKEVLYKTLKNPSTFRDTYNKAVEKLGNRRYTL